MKPTFRFFTALLFFFGSTLSCKDTLAVFAEGVMATTSPVAVAFGAGKTAIVVGLALAPPPGTAEETLSLSCDSCLVSLSAVGAAVLGASEEGVEEGTVEEDDAVETTSVLIAFDAVAAAVGT